MVKLKFAYFLTSIFVFTFCFNSEPVTAGEIQPDSLELKLVELAQTAASSIKYSGQKLKRGTSTSGKQMILNNGYGHCGHFAYLFTLSIQDFIDSFTIFDLKSETGAVHSLVEIRSADRRSYVVDPTLGIVYKGKLSDFLLGEVPHSLRDINEKALETKFRGYFGNNFLKPKTKVVRTHENLTDLETSILNAAIP